MNDHEKWMRLAVRQARIGWNTTQPNPAVGAIIIKSGKILGSGYTLPAGGDHAEIQAIKNAPANDLKGATMYVTLEPCSYYGKTPPCAEALINGKISKVVIGVKDPSPLVKGRGVQKLREAGIKVIENVLADEISLMYKGYFTFITKSRPYITIKLAQSRNGCIAGPDKKPIAITSKQARVWAHNFRAHADAVLISASTARIDNPMLDARLCEHPVKRDPKRIILGLKSDLGAGLNVFRDDGIETIVFSKKRHSIPPRIKQYLLPSTDFKENFLFVLQEFYKKGIHYMLIEPGARLVNKFLQTNLFDTFFLFTSPYLINGGYEWNESGSLWKEKLKLCKSGQVGEDWLEEFTSSKAE